MNFLKKSRSMFFAALLAVASVTPTLQAQSVASGVKVNVPFAFECGPQHYAAGTYLIKMNNPHFTELRGAKRSGLAMMRVESASQPTTRSRAVFRMYGDRYFLREIWSVGETEHISFLMGKGEKRAQVQVAANAIPSTTVELALLEGPRR